MFLLDIYKKINNIQSREPSIEKPKKEVKLEAKTSPKEFKEYKKAPAKTSKKFVEAGFCNYIKDYKTFTFSSKQQKTEITIKDIDSLDFEDAEINTQWHAHIKRHLYSTIGNRESKARIFVSIEDNKEATIYMDFDRTVNLLDEIRALKDNFGTAPKKPTQSFKFN